MMIFSLWAGSLADRYPKRSILIGTQAAQMFCAFVLAAGAHLGFANANFIIVIAALNGIAMGFDIPARQAFTVEMTSREDLLNAISLNSSIFHAARVIGTVGIAICFFLNGLSFIAVIAGLMMMKLPLQRGPATQASPLEHAWKGIVYSIRHPRVRTILLLFFVVGVFGWSYTVLMPAFARDVLGRGANGYGILMSASGAGALIGALIVAAYGHLVTPRKLAFSGVYLFSSAMTAVAFARSFYLAAAFLFLAGFGMLLFFATSNTTLQTIVPDEMRGRVMGVWSLVFGTMIPVGSLEAGVVAHFWGTPFALGFGAIICLIAAIITRVVIARPEATAATSENCDRSF